MLYVKYIKSLFQVGDVDFRLTVAAVAFHLINKRELKHASEFLMYIFLLK